MDWGVVATVVAPVITLFLGAVINSRLGPRLVAYYQHVAYFRHRSQDGSQSFEVCTHAVVIRNSGRKVATGIRIQHQVLPSFFIFPQIHYVEETLPDGNREIVIPRLVPGEQVTVSYLYFPPLTYAGINTGIKYDQGFARHINVLLARQYPRAVRYLLIALSLVGAMALVYVAYHIAKLLLGA